MNPETRSLILKLFNCLDVIRSIEKETGRDLLKLKVMVGELVLQAEKNIDKPPAEVD